jgi:hypothetical protein
MWFRETQLDCQFYYDEQGRKTRVRTISQDQALFIVMETISHQTQPGFTPIFTPMFESRMLEVAVAGAIGSSAGFTVTTSYNENDRPIESLIRNPNGELLTKVNQNYKNGRLISETLVIVRPNERLLMMQRAMREGQRVECSYTYDADDRVIRTLTQVGDSKEDESKTYNEQGDEDWMLMIRNGIDDVRSEFRYLYQYDSHGNWTERTTINTDQPGDPNTQRRTLAYY